MPTAPAAGTGTDVFQFSAVSDLATAPVREQEVNAYLIRKLPDRITKTSCYDQREAYGTFFANVLIPEDFRKLTEGPANLTLEVDETTANYPWEMIVADPAPGNLSLSQARQEGLTIMDILDQLAVHGVANTT
jgi:hypothetical protein